VQGVNTPGVWSKDAPRQNDFELGREFFLNAVPVKGMKECRLKPQGGRLAGFICVIDFTKGILRNSDLMHG